MIYVKIMMVKLSFKNWDPAPIIHNHHAMHLPNITNPQVSMFRSFSQGHLLKSILYVSIAPKILYSVYSNYEQLFV